jgi:hypothetical protein
VAEAEQGGVAKPFILAEYLETLNNNFSVPVQHMNPDQSKEVVFVGVLWAVAATLNVVKTRTYNSGRAARLLQTRKLLGVDRSSSLAKTISPRTRGRIVWIRTRPLSKPTTTTTQVPACS